MRQAGDAGVVARAVAGPRDWHIPPRLPRGRRSARQVPSATEPVREVMPKLLVSPVFVCVELGRLRAKGLAWGLVRCAADGSSLALLQCNRSSDRRKSLPAVPNGQSGSIERQGAPWL